MSNPFENDDMEYTVLVNDEGQHSLWPAMLDVPPGWLVTFGPAMRQPCLDYVDRHWSDMRPKSLVESVH